RVARRSVLPAEFSASGRGLQIDVLARERFLQLAEMGSQRGQIAFLTAQQSEGLAVAIAELEKKLGVGVNLEVDTDFIRAGFAKGNSFARDELLQAIDLRSPGGADSCRKRGEGGGRTGGHRKHGNRQGGIVARRKLDGQTQRRQAPGGLNGGRRGNRVDRRQFLRHLPGNFVLVSREFHSFFRGSNGHAICWRLLGGSCR